MTVTAWVLLVILSPPPGFVYTPTVAMQSFADLPSCNAAAIAVTEMMRDGRWAWKVDTRCVPQMNPIEQGKK
jgi:hypothetical protein